MNTVPSVVLICHEGDRLDTEGLASWLASTMDLRGLGRHPEQPAAALADGSS